MKLSSFHQFLINKRVFCEIGSCMRRAVTVIKDECNHDLCVCDLPEHSGLPPQTEEDWYKPKAKRV